MLGRIRKIAVTLVAASALAAVGSTASPTPASATYPSCEVLIERAGQAWRNYLNATRAGDEDAADIWLLEYASRLTHVELSGC